MGFNQRAFAKEVIIPDRSQAIVTHSLRQAGFYTIKNVDAIQSVGRFKQLRMPDDPGRADLTVIKNGRCCFVEVKDGDRSFAFNEWRSNQREWADLMWKSFNTYYAIALCIGTDRPDANPQKYTPKRLFIIRQDQFLLAENVVQLVQDSIPYLATKGYNTYLQENKLDAVHLFQEYELFWEQGKYNFPHHHWFLSIFEG